MSKFRKLTEPSSCLCVFAAETTVIPTRMDAGMASTKSRSFLCSRPAERSIAYGSLLLALSAGTLQAQDTAPDIIHGRVTDDSSRAIVATMMVTRGPDRLTQQTTTDSAGNFRVRFDPGTGDYLVYVSAAGFTPARRRVQRQTDEHDLVANFTLARAPVALLDTVKITGQKPERAKNYIGPTELEAGSSEKWRDGVDGQVPPTVAGDLNAIAGTMSNITMTGSGPAILGSGSESNLNTLNGMGLATGAIPRAAHTETRVTGATFDPTRGGFSGANVDVRLEPGDREYQRRNGFLTFDPRFLQFTDRAWRSLGATSGGVRGSAGADGEIIRDAMTYNVALDVGRSLSDPSTLLTAHARAFLNAGVAPDSVARLIDAAVQLGFPLIASGLPTNREHNTISWLGRLDDTRDTLSTRALTTYAGWTRDGAVGFSPLSAPSAASERRERTLGAQLTLGSYVGAGRRTLNETRIALSGVRTDVSPYRSLPGASVLIRSDNPAPGTEVTSVLLGGGAFLPTKESKWTLEAGNQTEWNAHGRTHRFKGLLWGRVDGLREEGFSNGLGSYAFNSIGDFTAGRASSFSRTLFQPSREGKVWNTAAALAHNFAPSRYFSLLYGARLEADGFGGTPARNVALEQALGVRTGVAPSRVHLSPRIGFTFTYNRDRDNGSGTMMNQTGTYFRSMSGTLRGGIGEFRDLLHPGILADASASTGLPGGTSFLNCIGAAVPAPDWSLFATDPASIPTQCAGGGGVLAESAPSVTLIDPRYDVPRSWRASLDWNTSLKSWLFKVGTLASYDLSQPGLVDANFSGVRKLTLADEANRPVYVSGASIDPASGSVSAVESRTSGQYGGVGVRVSDLRGYGAQLNLGLSPDVFKFRTGASFYGSIAYTLQATKRQYRGFDGAAFGDPRLVEWAAGPNDAHHVIVLSSGFSTAKTGTVTMFARAQSGLPFTPLVGGDVNGDGRGGDRAYIPDPATASDANLAAELRTLLANGSSTARGCLVANLGRVAPRNGCRGPWTQSLNIQWTPPIRSRWANRVSPNVYLQNVLAGVDQLVHGNSLRGWGSPAMPDPVLLVPRGFDAVNGRFNYDVNPRFADTRPERTLLRNPFRIVIDFSLDLSTEYDLQRLRRAVEPVKGPTGWQRRSADSLSAFYLSRTSDIYNLLIEQSDSLFLSRAQVAALQRADSVFSARVRALYVPLGEFLARGEGGAGRAELDSVRATQKTYWKVFWEQPEIAAEIVTPSQRELMPVFKSMLGIPMKDREHSQWGFGHPVTWAKKPTQANISVAESWHSAPPMLHARSAHAVVGTGDAIYAIGGTGAGGAPVLQVERFDGNEWRDETTLPDEGLNAPAAVAIGQRIYVIGGFKTVTNVPTTDVLVYDVNTHLWSNVAPLPAPRGGHAAVVVDGKIHVIGGGNSRSTLADHSEYDPAVNTWTERAPLPRSEGSPAAVAFNGKLYAIGGRSGPSDFGNVYIYDPVTDRWSEGPAIEPRGTAGAAVYCGTIYVFGGESQAKNTVLNDVLTMGSSGNGWRAAEPMPSARNYARAALLGNSVYLVGGNPVVAASHSAVGSTLVERFQASCPSVR